MDSLYNGFSFNANLIIGDNDNGFVQTKELAWICPKNKSIQESTEGQIILSDSHNTISPYQESYNAFFTKEPIKIDGMIDKVWSRYDYKQLNNLLYGYTKDIFDLSSFFKVCWDKNNLYFLTYVIDSKQKHITPEKLEHLQIFVDYGWIEDKNGNKVWEMNAKYSKHFGGALKNQFIDTVVQLNKGSYTLHYLSDESHAYSNWNDEPPSFPFYGIVLYEK